VRSPLEHAVGPSFGRRLTGIEGMRALAALTIVVYHVWLYASPGDAEPASLGYFTRFIPDFAFGVTLFFALSGFLLYRPFVSALLREKTRPSFPQYLRNRALRILPAYWAILFLTSFVLRSALVRDSAGGLHTGTLDDPSLLARNALLVHNYEPDGVVTGIGPAWSLSVEVVFYLTLPLLVLLAFALGRRATTRTGRRLAALSPPLLLLVVGLLGKATAAYLLPATTPAGGWGADWHSVLERSFLSQADLFTFGMALAVVRVDAEDGLVRLGRRGRWATAAVALGAYLITAKLTGWAQLGHSPFNTLMAFAAALFLALVVLPGSSQKRPALTRLLESRPLVGVGLVSYSLFLWHEPVIRFFHDHNLTVGGNAGFFVNLLLALSVSLFLSALTYLLVEKPALMLKRRTPQPAASTNPAPAAS
jgi:peptidoglycan/LPS O-acetylase OafA/YrhL